MRGLRAGLHPVRVGAAVVILCSSGQVIPLRAQDPALLAASCATAGGEPERCAAAALGARALLSHQGLLAGLGSEIPGSPSTLGTRVRGQPRVSVSFRSSIAHVGLPDVQAADAPLGAERTFIVPTFHGGVAVGVFEGFSPMPTVGGIFSLDLMGGGGLSLFPSSEGFRGQGRSLSVGLRVGLLRESFTLPGVTLSASRRWSSAVVLGDAQVGELTQLDVSPRVASYRITVGKNLVGVGVLAGAGVDDYSGAVSIQARNGLGTVASASSTGSTTRRTLFFAGASMNFLVLQMSVEGGWARGLPAVPAFGSPAFDPTGGTPFGGLAFRLTY